MGDTMDEIGFRHLLEAPADILGKPLTLLHWSGMTERTTLESKDDALMSVKHGWTRYRIEEDHTND